MAPVAHPAPADAPPACPDDAVEVGRIVGAWGVKGAFKVKPHSSDPQALFSSKRWFLREPQATDEGAVRRKLLLPAQPLRVIQAREHGDFVVASAQDIGDRNAAEALHGALVLIARSSFPTPEAGEYYWVDLIGCEVHDRQGTPLGVVAGLLETGPHCVLRVRPEAADAEETLIPFVDAYVDRVDLAARRIHVDWARDF